MRVIQDCADDGQIEGHYAPQALIKALHNLPSDGNEYTDCANTIRHALDGGSGRTGGPPPNGIVTESGAVAASPNDVKALEQTISHIQDGGAGPATDTTAPASSGTQVMLGEFGTSSGVAYHPDLKLLGLVIVFGVLAIAGAALLRRRRGAL